DVKKIATKLKGNIVVNRENIKRFVLSQYKVRLRRLKTAKSRVVADLNKYKKRVLSTRFKKELKNEEIRFILSKRWEKKHTRYVVKLKKIEEASGNIQLLYLFLKLEK